jgi:hypothetical protein
MLQLLGEARPRAQSDINSSHRVRDCAGLVHDDVTSDGWNVTPHPSSKWHFTHLSPGLQPSPRIRGQALKKADRLGIWYLRVWAEPERCQPRIVVRG